MKKRCFLSKNRRYINKSTKKRGRKSKGSKNSKRVKKVNTNIRKNKTKKGRRNIQKGGVWYKITQGVKNQGVAVGNETFWYDLNKNDKTEVDDFLNKATYKKDPKRTWREYVDSRTNIKYYANDARDKSEWTLPSPDPTFELTEVPYHASVSHGSVADLYNDENTDLSQISGLLFYPTILTNPREGTFFTSELVNFVNSIHKNPEYRSYDISKQRIEKGWTILYAACRTPYVSLIILDNLIRFFNCSPHIRTYSGFYPLGALMMSLKYNIIPSTFLDVNLLRKYIAAIKILIAAPSLSVDSIIKYKNIHGFTGYDDFATMGIYNSIQNCKQLNELCKLLLIDPNDTERQRTTVLFEACNASNIYPELIKKLIDCGNDVNEESIISRRDEFDGVLRPDVSKSGYPITALIKSYKRIIKEKGNPKNCKKAIKIVSKSLDMTKIPNYPAIEGEIKKILGT
jgi:hypothetical protein